MPQLSLKSALKWAIVSPCLAAAQKALMSEYAACVPEGGTNIQARTTAGAFGDVIKGLR
jgi:hypothetical protein